MNSSEILYNTQRRTVNTRDVFVRPQKVYYITLLSHDYAAEEPS